MRRVQVWAVPCLALIAVVFCLLTGPCLAGETTSAPAEGGVQAELSEALLTGVELSGFWRHSGDTGSEWRLVVRDPTGELLSIGPVEVEHVPGRWDSPQPKGEALLPRRSLLVDISRPGESDGPDSILLRSTKSALAENLGLTRLLGRLGMADSLLVSASPGLEDIDIAFGAEKVLPSVFGFGSQWAHFLTVAVQAERRSPEEAEPETSFLGSAHAYWGRGWGWESRLQSSAAMNAVRAAIDAAVSRVGTGKLGDARAIDFILASAHGLDSWVSPAAEAGALEQPIGPGEGRFEDFEEDAALGQGSSLRAFFLMLAENLPADAKWSELRGNALAWADDPTGFVRTRLAPALAATLVADEALDALTEKPQLSRAEAFRAAQLAGVPGDLGVQSVCLETLVDAIDPSILAVYHELYTVEDPAGDLPEVWRDVVGTAYRNVRWGRWEEWQARIVSYVAEHTLIWKPRVTFALDASAYTNSNSEAEAAALLDARLTWRPDPFQPYGITLSHKRGKEEQDRERRIDWTSLEFSYRF